MKNKRATLGELYKKKYVNKVFERSENIINNCGVVDRKTYFFNTLCRLRLGMFDGLEELIYERLEKVEEEYKLITSLKYVQNNEQLEFVKQDILRYYHLLSSLYLYQDKLITSYGIFVNNLNSGYSLNNDENFAKKLEKQYINHFLYLSDKELAITKYKKNLSDHVILHRRRRFSVSSDTVLKIIKENFDKAQTYYHNAYEKIFRCQGLMYKNENDELVSFEYLSVIFLEKDDPDSIITIYTLDGHGDLNYFDLTPYAYEKKFDEPNKLSEVKTNRVRKFEERQNKMSSN